MARPTKRAKSVSSTATKTKVQAVTSIKLALSVLALGFASLAAAAATTPVIKKPDLVISKMQLNYTGYYYNNLPVVSATLVVKNIGNVGTPSNRPFRINFKSDANLRLICGFGQYNCQAGKILPLTKPGSGVSYLEVSAGSSISPGSERLVEFLLGGISHDKLKNFTPVIGLRATLDTAKYFAEIKTNNNQRIFNFLSKQLVVKPFNPSEFIPDLCGAGYGYDNYLGCYELSPVIPGNGGTATGPVPTYGCELGYGYNSLGQCVAK